jgi:Ca-activated chloride channel family protein
VKLVFEHPLAGLAAATLIGLLLAGRRLPSRGYSRRSSFHHPLADYVEPPVYRRPRKLLLLELLLAALLPLAAASPAVEYTVVKHVEKQSQTQLQIPPRPAAVIIIDVSGSMAGLKLAEAKKALTLLVEKLAKLNTTVDIGLIAFSHKVELALPPGTNTTKILEAIESLKAGGGTMYTYPLSLAYSWLKVYRDLNQTAVIVFASDGLPADRLEYRQVLEKLAEMRVHIYTVFIGDDPQGIEELKYMAKKGHGKSYVAKHATELLKVFEKIASETSRILANTTVTAKLTVKARERKSLTIPLYTAALTTLLILAAARYREAKLAV